MTPNQQKFADEYIKCGNATQAYKIAYPTITKQRTAESAGARLLTNVKVLEYIEKKLQEISNAKIADAAEVMQYLTMVLRGESKAEVVVVEGCGDGYSEARRIEKAPDEKERLKAAELLGKRYNLFIDKLQIEQDTTLTVNIEGDFDEC